VSDVAILCDVVYVLCVDLTCVVFLFRVIYRCFFGWLFVFVVLCPRVMACFLVYCCYDDIIVCCVIVVQFVF